MSDTSPAIAGPHALAWSVLLINVVGSFGLGALTVLVLARGAPSWVGPALGTGFRSRGRI